MSSERDRPEGAGVDPAEVCSLPPQGLQERLAWIEREILPRRVASERLERGIALELATEPGLADKLDRLIELERDCCSGIVFERGASESPERLRLEIRGVDPEAPIFRSLLG